MNHTYLELGSGNYGSGTALRIMLVIELTNDWLILCTIFTQADSGSEYSATFIHFGFCSTYIVERFSLQRSLICDKHPCDIRCRRLLSSSSGCDEEHADFGRLGNSHLSVFSVLWIYRWLTCAYPPSEETPIRG